MSDEPCFPVGADLWSDDVDPGRIEEAERLFWNLMQGYGGHNSYWREWPENDDYPTDGIGIILNALEKAGGDDD